MIYVEAAVTKFDVEFTVWWDQNSRTMKYMIYVEVKLEIYTEIALLFLVRYSTTKMHIR